MMMMMMIIIIIIIIFVIKLLPNYTCLICRSPKVYELWPNLHLLIHKLIKSVSCKITQIYIYIYIYIYYPQFHSTNANDILFNFIKIKSK